MKMNKFCEDLIEKIKKELPKGYENVIEIKVNEVVKTNDEVLTGIALVVPGCNVMPTLYLENLEEEYRSGTSIEELAQTIVEVSLNAFRKAQEIENFSMEYENIKDKLVVQLVDGDKNAIRLSELVHKPVGNGFAMIPYITMGKDEGGFMRAAVTKALAKAKGYDEEELMDDAFRNVIENSRPVMTGTSNMYMLTNEEHTNGACTLFYPGLAKEISEAIGQNFYVLPSSLHEVMIVPEDTLTTVAEMKRLVKEVNDEVVDTKDILSDKVLFYKREDDSLVVM